MKTLILAAAAVLATGSAFAMEAPINIGDYSASVESRVTTADSDADMNREQAGAIDTITTAAFPGSGGDAASAPLLPWEYQGGR